MGPFGLEPGCIDTLVLGCTHYPFATELLRAHVTESVAFMEGGAPVARQTRRLLEARAWLAVARHAGDASAPAVVFGTTGDTTKMQVSIARWLQWDADVQPLTIE